MSDRIQQLCDTLASVQLRQAEAEAAVADLKAAARRITEEDLPSVMIEMGLTDVTTGSGLRVKLCEEVAAAITEANRPAAHAWLIANGFGGLIKTQVIVEFGRGDVEAAQAFAAAAAEGGHSPLNKEAVHPATLKSFVKEQMAQGAAIPLDIFGIHPYNVAKISNGTRGR